MLILYGNIFKVTRNRLPADVRLRRDGDVDRGAGRRLDETQLTTKTLLKHSVNSRSTMTATVLAASHLRRQRTNSDDSSGSSDGKLNSYPVTARNSECFEMIPVEAEPDHVSSQPDDIHRPSATCSRQTPTRSLSRATALGPRTWLRSNGSSNSQLTSVLRHSSSSKPPCRRTAASMAGAVRRENKAAKTLAIVVGGFVVCWLPFFILYVVEPFCTTCVVSDALRGFLTWLGYANSLINPFIYATYNRHFRYSFWRLTVGHFYACLPRTNRQHDVTETRVTL